jgi:predicted enzyme related to lactoylglutathione lyase
MMTTPVFHFEIPVADLDRAIRFYEAVFEVQLRRATVDGHAMAFFPRVDGAPGASGALAMGDTYVPSTRGTLVYFDVADVDATVARALAHGGRLLYPKKDVGAAGFVAEVEDSEGNRIALNAVPTSPTAE